MYHSYFGLEEQAFSIAVNPRYLFMSAQHREALAHLLYGVNNGGFVMLSGEVGTGKTTIIRCLLEQLPETADLAVIMNPSATSRDLLCSICDEFNVSYATNESSLKTLTDTLNQFLVENHRRQRKSIVLIDEAQLLQVSTLEQVRLLTNLETNTQKLLQIILVGQPELNELLARPALRQLSQRITARYHLRSLTEAETAAYIKHRLSVAGLPAGQAPFSPKLITKIHSISNGIPRLINVLCDRMLLGAYSKGTSTVDNTISRQAITEVLGENTTYKKTNATTTYSMLAVVTVLLAAVMTWSVFVLNLLPSPAPSIAHTAPITTPATTTPPSLQVQPLNQSPQPILRHTTSELDLANKPYYVKTQNQAVHTLAKLLGIDVIGSVNLCESIAAKSYRCESQKASNWSEFLTVNRPAVLNIITASKQLAYVTLIGLTDEYATVMVGDDSKQIRLSELGALWTGEYTFIWLPPEPFRSAIGEGANGAMVAWIAQQFARLDQQTTPITETLFNVNLKKRVIFFQRKHDLDDDGVVGLQTLLRLNEELGLEQSLTDIEQRLTEGN